VIGCTGVPQLLFEGTQGGFVALLPFDFQFMEVLDSSALLHNRGVIQSDLSDRHPSVTHKDAASPDTQSHDRH
jgi:hypothetical protein